jgi:hypothetical protein
MIATAMDRHQGHSIWDKDLHLLTLAYNTSVHAGTNEIPFYLAHGRDARFILDVKHESLRFSNPNLYKQRMIPDLKAFKAIVASNNWAAKQRNADAFNSRRSAPPFALGDLMMLHTPALSHSSLQRNAKFSKQRKGPFRITSEVRYTFSLASTNSPSRLFPNIHATRLKHFFASGEDISSLNPPDVAL